MSIDHTSDFDTVIVKTSWFSYFIFLFLQHLILKYQLLIVQIHISCYIMNKQLSEIHFFFNYVEPCELKIDRMCSTDVFQHISEDKFL